MGKVPPPNVRIEWTLMNGHYISFTDEHGSVSMPLTAEMAAVMARALWVAHRAGLEAGRG